MRIGRGLVTPRCQHQRVLKDLVGARLGSDLAVRRLGMNGRAGKCSRAAGMDYLPAPPIGGQFQFPFAAKAFGKEFRRMATSLGLIAPKLPVGAVRCLAGSNSTCRKSLCLWRADMRRRVPRVSPAFGIFGMNQTDEEG